MFSHTFLNILNILLTSFCSSLSLAVSFRVFVCVLPYCAFPSMECTTSLQFHHSLFLSTLYSEHKILLFSCSNTFLTIASFLSHFTHFTLVISLLFASSSLQFHASWHRPYHMFLTCLSRRNLVPDFCRSIPSCLHIFHSLHMLLPFLLLSILSLAEVYFWGAYSSLYNIPTPFPIQDMPAFFLAVPFVVWSHVLPLPFFFSSLLLFNLNIWAFPFKMADPPTSETFHFLYHLLSPHFYLFPYSTLHHSTCYYFKFILGN